MRVGFLWGVLTTSTEMRFEGGSYLEWVDQSRAHEMENLLCHAQWIQ